MTPRSEVRVPTSPEWEELRKALEALADATGAFNAYVLDAWDYLFCAARWFEHVYADDLAAVVRAAVARNGIPLQRGGKLDLTILHQNCPTYLRTYGSCYVLVLRFAAPFEEGEVRQRVAAVLPRLELLTISLPPPDGPGSAGNEAMGSA